MILTIDEVKAHLRIEDDEEDEYIRYRSDVKPGMWVLFQDEKWNISTLGEYSFRKKYLGLKASIAKGVSG